MVPLGPMLIADGGRAAYFGRACGCPWTALGTTRDMVSNGFSSCEACETRWNKRPQRKVLANIFWCAVKFKFLIGKSHTLMFLWDNCRSAELFQIQYLDNQGWLLQESSFRALVDFV